MGGDPPHGSGPGRGVQHRVDRRFTGRQPRRLLGGSWEYPPLEEAMQEAEFCEVEAYVPRRKNTVAKYIVMQLVLDICKETVYKTGCGLLIGGGIRRHWTWMEHDQRQQGNKSGGISSI